MNKAFIREPDSDARVLCPRCGTPGNPVGSGPLNVHIRPDARNRLQDSAWCCGQVECSVAYFDMFETVVLVSDLRSAVYPHNLDAPICACFGFCYTDIEADLQDGQPVRIRQLLARSATAEARCQSLAFNGRCCVAEVQRMYMKLRNQSGGPMS